MRSVAITIIVAFMGPIAVSAAGASPVLYDYHPGNRTQVDTKYTHVDGGDPIYGWSPKLTRYFWFEGASGDDKVKMTVMQDGKAVAAPSRCDVDIDIQNVMRDGSFGPAPVAMNFDCAPREFLEKNEGGIVKGGVYTASFDYYSATEDEDYKGFAVTTLPITSMKDGSALQYFPDFDAFAHQAFISEYAEDGGIRARFSFWRKYAGDAAPDLKLSCKTDGKAAFGFKFVKGDSFELPDDSAIWVRHQSNTWAWIRPAEGSDTAYIDGVREQMWDNPNYFDMSAVPGFYTCKARNDDGDVVVEFSYEVADGKIVPSGCEGELILPLNTVAIKMTERSAQMEIDPATVKLPGGFAEGC